MDDENVSVLELNCGHLQGDTAPVISQEDHEILSVLLRLIEREGAVFDDVADALTADAMAESGIAEAQCHSVMILHYVRHKLGGSSVLTLHAKREVASTS